LRRLTILFTAAVLCLIPFTAHAQPTGDSSEQTLLIASAQETANPAKAGSEAGYAHQDAQVELGNILPIWSVIPFVLVLLAIAIIPLLHGGWWESHLNKGVVSFLCSLPIVAYFLWLGPIGPKVLAEILHDYYAFITLLVALFTISGGSILKVTSRPLQLLTQHSWGLEHSSRALSAQRVHQCF